MVRNMLIKSLFAVGFVWLTACYPSNNKSTEDLDVVVTRYDEETDFQAYNTFHVADTIIQIGDPESSGYIDLELTREEMDVILNKIRSEMKMFNYTEITTPSLDSIPDVGIFTDAIAAEITVVYTYPPYWGWGWYPGYPGWGWGGGWYYPPAVGSYSYPVGTLVINYIDIEKTIKEDGKDYIYTPWVGILNGLLYQTSSGDTRITNLIEQMFTQSQYLRQN